MHGARHLRARPAHLLAPANPASGRHRRTITMPQELTTPRRGADI